MFGCCSKEIPRVWKKVGYLAKMVSSSNLILGTDTLTGAEGVRRHRSQVSHREFIFHIPIMITVAMHLLMHFSRLTPAEWPRRQGGVMELIGCESRVNSQLLHGWLKFEVEIGSWQ